MSLVVVQAPRDPHGRRSGRLLGVQSSATWKETVRVTTAFNRLLALPGAPVTDVLLGRRGRRAAPAPCSSCGQVCRRVHDRAWRRWRHLDLGGQRCHVEYQLRRVRCPDCGVWVEALAWAWAGARHTRDFEDLVAFMAQQMAKTPISRLLRIGWDTLARSSAGSFMSTPTASRAW
jgi:hypothetical protein